MSSNSLYLATLTHYEAKKAKALAHLEVCLNSPVHVGEHTDFLSELVKWTDELSHAEECLVSLEKNKPQLLSC